MNFFFFVFLKTLAREAFYYLSYLGIPKGRGSHSFPHLLQQINKKGIVSSKYSLNLFAKRPISRPEHCLVHGLMTCSFTPPRTSVLQEAYRICPLKQSKVNLPWLPHRYQKNCLLRLINRSIICFLDFYFFLYKCFHRNITNTCYKMSDKLSNYWDHQEIPNRSEKNLTQTKP